MRLHHMELCGARVHFLGKCFRRIGQIQRYRIRTIVAGSHHHAAGDVAECKHLPGAQPHRGALHAYHFRRDRHGITPMLTFKRQQRRHDFRRARNGQYLAAVLFK